MLGLEELGLTKEELRERVVEGLCERLLTSTFCDEDGEPTHRSSRFKGQLDAEIKKQIDAGFAAMCEKYVVPNVEAMIANIVIHVTNGYGEKKAEPMTLREYLVKTGEDWLMEGVDHNGDGKLKRDSYGWKESQTRLVHFIHKHLQYEIETGLKDLLKDPLAQMSKAVGETCKLKMREIADKLQVAVTTK